MKYFVLIVIIIVVFLVSMIRCSSDRIPEFKPISSPDNKMNLVPSINYDKNSGNYLKICFKIYDDKGSVVYSQQTSASDIMKWEMGWINNTMIYLDSSDIGDCYWDKQDDGTWETINPYHKRSPYDNLIILEVRKGKDSNVKYRIMKEYDYGENSYSILYEEQTSIPVKERKRYDLKWLDEWTWLSNDTIKCENEKLGTLYWDKQDDGTWKKRDPNDTSINNAIP